MTAAINLKKTNFVRVFLIEKKFPFKPIVVMNSSCDRPQLCLKPLSKENGAV